MKTSDLVVAQLLAAGLGPVFGRPGAATHGFTTAAQRAGLALVPGTRDDTCGWMAKAHGQLTGRPGVWLSAPARAADLVPVLAAATHDRAPMIALSVQTDPAPLLGDFAKWSATLPPGQAAEGMRAAWRVAAAEPPGPVHLACSAEALAARVNDDDRDIDRDPQPPSTGPAPRDQAGPLPSTPPAWAAARRPVMLLGHAAQRAQAGPAVRRLADALGCPVVVTPMAKGLLSDTHPLHAGTLGMAGDAQVCHVLHQADLWLAIGLDAAERPELGPLQRPTLHIGGLPDAPAPDEAAAWTLPGDISATLNALRSTPPSAVDWTRAEISAHRQLLREACHLGRVAGRLNLGDLIDTLRAAMPVDALLAVDGGAHRPLVGQCWTTPRPRHLLMGTQALASGEALPAAIAAQLLDPLQPVVCLLGEDGLAMVQAELRVAAALKLSPTVLVLCDGRPPRAAPSALPRIDGTDVALLAQSMGCDGLLVDSVRALAAALAAPRASDRPLVIGAFIEPIGCDAG